MNLLPSPLHPAVVHFPVVLVLLGAVTAVAAAFWRRHQVPVFAAVLLALGAAGTWVAIETGEGDGSLLESLTTAANALLEEHERWAERTLVWATIAAVLATGSAALVRFPRIARTTAVVAAVAAVVASVAVYQTGHRGGALVFRHQAGVALVAAGEAAPATAGPARRGHDDDD